MVKEWLNYRRFRVHETSHKRKPMTRGFEHEIKFMGQRKESEYVMYIINVYIHAMYTEDVEVIENGVKKKLQKTGSLYIELWPTVRLDWQNKWESSKFTKNLREFFNKYILKTYIAVILVDRVYYITYKLHTRIKELLDYQSKYNAFEDLWQT